MTNPTASTGRTTTPDTGPTGAWTLEAGRHAPEPLDVSALPPLAELAAHASRPRLGDLSSATWVRVADHTVMHDVAASLGPGGGAWLDRAAGAPGQGRPLAHVHRIARDWLLVATPTTWFTPDDSQVHTGRFAMLLGPGVVITGEEGGADVHAAMLEHLRGPGTPHGDPVRRVAAAAVSAIVTGAAQIELELGEAVAQTEKVVFASGGPDPVPRIYDLKREITEARRGLLPVTAELPELLDPDLPEHLGVDKHLVERLATTVERVDRHLDAHDGLLSDMLSVHMTQVSVRQNEDMRRISAWAAILVFPTIVAGIYGMNFAVMPELGWVWGYPISLAIMAVGCLVLYRVFKRVGWL